MYLAKAIKNTFWKDNVTEADANSTIFIHKDIPYKDSGHLKHCLNIFVPKIEEDKEPKLFPVLIFAHGGSWRRGDRNHRWFDTYNKFCAQLCCNMEFVVVNISYRLSPEVKHPGHMLDVLHAFRFVHENIAQYTGDPNRVMVCGHSAGGHLVTMCTLFIACRELFEDMNEFDYSFPSDFIKGCVPISAVYDLNRLSTMGYLVNRYIVEPAFIRHPQLNNYDAASPLEMLRKLRQKIVDSDPLPPFLCLNAENDWGLDLQTVDFVEVLNDPRRFIRKRYLNSKTNHLSIIGLHTGYGNAYPLVITDIAEFAHSVFHMEALMPPSPIVRVPQVVPYPLQDTDAKSPRSETTEPNPVLLETKDADHNPTTLQQEGGDDDDPDLKEIALMNLQQEVQLESSAATEQTQQQEPTEDRSQWSNLARQLHLM